MSETGGAFREITSSHNRSTIDLGYGSETIENGLNRASLLLSGISGGVYRAMGSAVKRALAAGKTAAKQAVTKEYAISQGEFLKNTKSTNHYTHDTDGNMVWEIGYAGYVIPLVKFKTRPGRDGRLVTQVKRANSAQILQHAFISKIYGHQGVFERIGAKRFPVRELYGPSGVNMLDTIAENGELFDTIEEKIFTTFEERLEHEINAILNGWRR